MRWIAVAAVLLAGCAATPEPDAGSCPVEPAALKKEIPADPYQRLDYLMSEALHGYAQGDMQKVRKMAIVLEHLTQDVDRGQLATVAGLRASILTRLQTECDKSEDSQSEYCYASLKATRFFDEVDMAARDVRWDGDSTYTIAEYASRARRALALYEWRLSP